jgi:hypothetical protein
VGDTNTAGMGPSNVGRNDASTVADAIRMIESYETVDGMVFYDAENPLAWMLSDHVVDLDSSA